MQKRKLVPTKIPPLSQYAINCLAALMALAGFSILILSIASDVVQ